jgi:hypothetical protein
MKQILNILSASHGFWKCRKLVSGELDLAYLSLPFG